MKEVITKDFIDHIKFYIKHVKECGDYTVFCDTKSRGNTYVTGASINKSKKTVTLICNDDADKQITAKKLVKLFDKRLDLSKFKIFSKYENNKLEIDLNDIEVSHEGQYFLICKKL